MTHVLIFLAGVVVGAVVLYGIAVYRIYMNLGP